MFPEIVINIIVINKVKYTEIDWIAYMQVGLEFKILFRGEYSTFIYNFSFVEIIVVTPIAKYFTCYHCADEC